MRMATDAALSDGKITPAVPIHMDYVDHFDEAFQPERWLPGGTKPTAYIPFGSGAHMCPGMNLAYTETKLLLVELVRSSRASDWVVQSRCFALWGL